MTLGNSHRRKPEYNTFVNQLNQTDCPPNTVYPLLEFRFKTLSPTNPALNRMADAGSGTDTGLGLGLGLRAKLSRLVLS